VIQEEHPRRFTIHGSLALHSAMVLVKTNGAGDLLYFNYCEKNMLPICFYSKEHIRPYYFNPQNLFSGLRS
jgi:hypothetical protein